MEWVPDKKYRFFWMKGGDTLGIAKALVIYLVKAGIGWMLVCPLRALVRQLYDYQSSVAFKKRFVEEEGIK